MHAFHRSVIEQNLIEKVKVMTSNSLKYENRTDTDIQGYQEIII